MSGLPASFPGVSLRPEPSSVREARRFVGDRISALGYPDASTAAELLVSELVTNSVLHARTTVTVSVEARGEFVRIGVGDESPRNPRLRKHSLDAGTGRGLLLVDRLASRWGVEAAGAGKVVWFELTRDAGSDVDASFTWEV